MDILQVIKSRRSIAKLTDKTISNSIIEQIIEAGCHAPTHKRTEPWRFNVFTGNGRSFLQNAIEKHINSSRTNNEDKKRSLIKVQNKAYRAPVIIAVWCAVGRGKNNPPLWEDTSAVSACLQNMLLASHALGYASIWRTGNIVNMPEVQELCTTENDKFDLSKGDKIIGFLYIGERDTNKALPTRDIKGWKNKISWTIS